MNYFFALEVPDEVKVAVEAAAAEWQSLLKPPLKAKWLEPKDYHITLEFLGDQPVSSEAVLAEIAAPLAATVLPFNVQLSGFDGFGSLTEPRVLYIGVRPEAARIELTQELNTHLAEHGYQLEQRPPRPHLTVARHCRQKERLPWPGWPVPHERSFPFWKATRFVLMQTLPPESRAKDSKARYNIVHTFPLGSA